MFMPWLLSVLEDVLRHMKDSVCSCPGCCLSLRLVRGCAAPYVKDSLYVLRHVKDLYVQRMCPGCCLSVLRHMKDSVCSEDVLRHVKDSVCSCPVKDSVCSLLSVSMPCKEDALSVSEDVLCHVKDSVGSCPGCCLSQRMCYAM